MSSAAERIAVGYVARAHGVRGELRVHLHHAGSASLHDAPQVFLAGRVYTVDSVRPTSGALLVKLEGIDDKNAADALAGQPVEVARGAVELAEGEFLVSDLPGCVVVDTAGQSLGTVVSVMHGHQDILVIHDATHERLLPLVPVFVVEADIPGRRLVVDPPEGLPVEPLVRPARPARPPR